MPLIRLSNKKYFATWLLLIIFTTLLSNLQSILWYIKRIKKKKCADSDSDSNNVGTWDCCWFWLLTVRLLEAKWLLCALVKSKINTWYCVIIALRSCFMWYLKPFKKTIIKSLSKLLPWGIRASCQQGGITTLVVKGPKRREWYKHPSAQQFSGGRTRMGNQLQRTSLEK